ncbi:AMS1 [Candida oxycetoniae]|uniref:Alpha-mannosidase n=1 Tax=Candida oxycetoniae TaxID=497107 RepID=A0AAI9WWZ2_9ASCO|nr:AMS1 [Candida oxycetoniae]KAI3403518.1 AMS1 [Candida oxycetoniae]
MGYDDFNRYPNFKPVDHLYESRLRQFTNTGGQYAHLNLPRFYDIHRKEIGNLKSWRVPDKNNKTQRPLFRDIDFGNVKWENIGLGYSFGPSWKTFWVKFELDIPENWLKYETLEIDWDSSSEALIYDAKGLPLQAFTGGGQRNLFEIPKQFKKTGKQLFYIEVACNGMFGNGAEGEPDPNRYFRLNRAHLVVPNMEARRLFWDFWIISDAAREFPGGYWQKHQAADVATKIMNSFDPQDVNSITKCRELATKILGKQINSEDVFDTFTNEEKRVDVFGVGNCHIDTAWEWPFAETKRKIVRSWTTQLKIAEKYPEYVFVASQMQQFKWLKESHPKILKKIHAKFTTNQFIPLGGSWVENDTNLPNGESLIRQFVLGQRFLLDEFGFQSNIYWLPDTFGYSSQIPQICQLAGIDRFLTQKLSWNNINTFPLSTFNWKGINGSQVLVHMPPANTYTAEAHFGDVMRSQRQHKNLRDVPTGLLLYGHGDGGGGPTEEMIEKLRRCRGLSNECGGLLPSVALGVSIDEFYDHILAKSNNGATLPTWTGEIYLEFHRGTYTVQAQIKKFMRLGEIKLHDLELIAGITSLVIDDYKYPGKEIQELWEDLCLCQFHDVLPGSCIGMVYYEEVFPMLGKLLERANKLIRSALDVSRNKKGANEKELVNTLSHNRRNEIVEIDKSEYPDLFESLVSKGHSTVGTNDDKKKKIKINVDSIDGKTTIHKKVRFPSSVKVTDDGGYTLSNGLLVAQISSTGIITSLYDTVAEREIIDSSATSQTKQENKYVGGNQFILFDDEPLNFPAWDTELYSLEKFTLLDASKTRIIVDNPLESSILVTHEISPNSFMETVISLAGVNDVNTANNFIKFSSKVQWHETYKFLKVQFPTTINSALEANYETQFGITKRPTHYNTSWDVAKFEVCHHKFMDLSEHNYGVSILNNGKYGGSIHGNLMRLSLLRSAKAPDNRADMGVQMFEYAIYPHRGSLGIDTVHAGYNFNYKLIPSNADTNIFNAIRLEQQEGGSLVLSHIKRGENDIDVSQYASLTKEEKSIVVRVYESLGGESKGKLIIDEKLFHVDKIEKTNALENEVIEKVKIEKGNVVPITLKGFEISTYKILLK